MDRVLVVDKPKGMTSHDVVESVRRTARIRRVGHTGTLDPSATGVLIVLVGRATRLAQFFIDDDKDYRGEMILGAVTDTQDADGRTVSRGTVSGITAADVERAFERFVGQIEQVPPMVSAIKRDGTPLYVLARRGVVVAREPRKVLVRSLRLLGYGEPVAEFEVSCSKGTYVRTLAHDVGQVLGCGAHLGRLSRVRVGRFGTDSALSLEEVSRAGRDLDRVGFSMFEALGSWPTLRVDSEELSTIATGSPIEVGPSRLEGEPGFVRITPDGEILAAVGRSEAAGDRARLVRPVRVFTEAP